MYEVMIAFEIEEQKECVRKKGRASHRCRNREHMCTQNTPEEEEESVGLRDGNF